MKRILFALIITSALTGCATGLNRTQQTELKTWESKGLAVKEKDPATGAALGLLPGGGSFYARQPGLGIVNLLFWPFSVLWDPISGHDGSEYINYFATKGSVDKLQKKEYMKLEDDLTTGAIQKDEFIRKKREVESKYSGD